MRPLTRAEARRLRVGVGETEGLAGIFLLDDELLKRVGRSPDRGGRHRRAHLADLCRCFLPATEIFDRLGSFELLDRLLKSPHPPVEIGTTAPDQVSWIVYRNEGRLRIAGGSDDAV